MPRLPTAAEDAAWRPDGCDIEPSPSIAQQSELQALGSILMQPAMIDEVSAVLSPRDLVYPPNRVSYHAMLSLKAEGLPITVPMLMDRLRGAREFAGVDPATYWYEVVRSVGTAQHAPLYARQIVEARRKWQRVDVLEAALADARNGHTSQQIDDSLFAVMDDWRREREATSQSLSDLRPANEFINEDSHVEYLIYDTIVAGQGGIVSAKMKSLKTSIALAANVAMASGTKFLGVWQAPQAIRCAMYTAESGKATIQETLKRVAAANEIDVPGNLLVTTKCPKLRQHDWLDDIRRQIEAEDLRCVTIDPTYLALAGIDQNKLAAVAEALAPLSEIINDTGCTILMVHHNRKVTLTPYGAPTLEEITGSGFGEWARFWLLLNRRREWDAETGRHWLWLVSGGSAGFGANRWLDVREGKAKDIGGRVWKVDVLLPSEGESQEKAAREQQKEAVQQKELEADITKVCRLMAKHPNGISKTFVRDNCGVSSRRFPAVFHAMYEAEQIVNCEIQVGNKKTPQPGYKLNTESA